MGPPFSLSLYHVLEEHSHSARSAISGAASGSYGARQPDELPSDFGVRDPRWTSFTTHVCVLFVTYDRLSEILAVLFGSSCSSSHSDFMDGYCVGRLSVDVLDEDSPNRSTRD